MLIGYVSGIRHLHFICSSDSEKQQRSRNPSRCRIADLILHFFTPPICLKYFFVYIIYDKFQL
jgi:hypothetical protein